MADRTRTPGTRSVSHLVRRLAIGLGMVGVLVCSILGSGIVTLQEGVPYAGVRTTPTWPAATGGTTRPSPPLPSQTPTAAIVPLETSTPAGGTPGPVPGAQGMATLTRSSPTESAIPGEAKNLTPTAQAGPTANALVCRVPDHWRPYVVRAGDTLILLSWRFSTTVAAIMQANCMQTTALYAGRRLYLPPLQAPYTPTAVPCVSRPLPGWVLYIVQQDDTLYGLAQRHGTSVDGIRRVNCIVGDRLFAGQQIYLPYLPSTATPTWTLAPTSTGTPTLALTATLTPTVTTTATVTVGTPTPTVTGTVLPSPTVSPSSTVSPTVTGTSTLAPTVTPSATTTGDAATLTPTATEGAGTPTPTATGTSTPTETPTTLATTAPTSTDTVAPTWTSTPLATATPTWTPIPAATSTHTPIPTETLAPTRTPSAAHLP